RVHLLAMNPAFQNQRQVGIGVVEGGSGPLHNYYTIDTASAPGDNRVYLTGVVYNDRNGNGRYDIGEGLGGVTITVSGGGSVVTPDTGGFKHPPPPRPHNRTGHGGRA